MHIQEEKTLIMNYRMCAFNDCCQREKKCSEFFDEKWKRKKMHIIADLIYDRMIFEEGFLGCTI